MEENTLPPKEVPVPPAPPAQEQAQPQVGAASPVSLPNLNPTSNLAPAKAPNLISPLPLTSTICASCGAVVPINYTFCPNCGKPLTYKPLSTTVFSQIWIYGISVFLPPMGFWPGVKYFKSSDPKAQKMGMIAIVLTVVSTILSIWLTFYFVQSYLGDINSALSGTGISPAAGLL